MIDSYDILQVVCNVYAILYVHRFMLAFFGGAAPWKHQRLTPLLYLLLPVITTSVYFIWNFPMLNLVGNILAMLIISLQYQTSWTKRLISVGLMYGIMMLTDTLATLMTNYSGGSPFEESQYHNAFGLVFCTLLTHAIAYAIYHLKHLRHNVLMPKGTWLAITGVPVISFVTSVISHWSNELSQQLAILLCISFLLINACNIYLYDRIAAAYHEKLQIAILAEEKESYYAQCQLLQQSEHKQRAFRHEIRNQLELLYDLLKQGQTEQLKQCISGIEKALADNMVFSRTGHIALDSILNLKLTQAQRKGITVTCHSDIPEDLPLEPSDLMVIFGNLLDNAITAAETVEQNRSIAVNVLYDKGMLLITIENTYNGILQPEGSHFRSTKADSEHHGYGLQNVERTLEQYHGMLTFHHTEDVFIVDAALYCQ